MTNAQKRAARRAAEDRPAYSPAVTLCEEIVLEVSQPVMRRLRALKAGVEKQAKVNAGPLRAFASALLESAIDREEIALEAAREAGSIIIKPTDQQVRKVVVG